MTIRLTVSIFALLHLIRPIVTFFAPIRIQWKTLSSRGNAFAKLPDRCKSVSVKAINPVQFVLSPEIYPIFEEAVLFNTAQALLLTIVKQKALTNQGLVHATVLGIGLWTFLGFRGWIICVTYLILGSLATKVKMKEKEVF